MSRIGIQPITMPESVSFSQTDQVVSITGPKGELMLNLPDGISVAEKDCRLLVTRVNDQSAYMALHGTIRSLLANNVAGVSEGFTKKLELIGIGYRAAIENNELVLQVGFTHSVHLKVETGLEVKVEKNVISISGADKQRVGQFAAIVRDVRPPEPYKGKGIRYAGEIVRMKQGKAVKAGG